MSTANLFVPGAGFLAPGQTLDTAIDPDLDSVNTAFLEDGYNEFKIKSRGLALTGGLGAQRGLVAEVDHRFPLARQQHAL